MAIKEAKNQLSKYLRKVRDGEIVLITDRGRVVAQLAPPPLMLGDSTQDAAAALERLSRAGIVRLASGPIESAAALPDLDLPDDLDVEQALRDVRADR